MRAILPVLLLITGCAVPSYAPAPPNAIDPVVAVTSFENRSGFPGQWKLGTGMAELLLAEIIESDRFTPVERIQLHDVIGEISLQEQQQYFREEGRAEPGQLKNAGYLIRGTITDFSQVSGGGFSLLFRNIFLLGRSATARVALSLTIVEVETGEIVSSVQADGYASAYSGYVEADYSQVAFGGDAFFETPLGVATQEAIGNALRGILDRMPIQIWRPIVADANEREVVVNGGLDRGLRRGQRFVVRAASREVTDPLTGDAIAQLAGEVLGTIRLSRVTGSAAFAEIEDGGPFVRGQWLEPADGR